MQDTVMEMRAVAPNTLFRQRGIGGTALDPAPGCKSHTERTVCSAAAIGLRATCTEAGTGELLRI